MNKNDLHPWRFVEEYYPNYHSSQEIADNDDLAKILDGEINGNAETILREDYEGNIDNPKIQLDFNESLVRIYEEAITNFLKQQS